MDLGIGELSRVTQVKVPTIRYYEQIGLVAEPPRTEGGQRRYGDQHVRQIGFIRHARELGFDIDAIRQLLTLSADPQLPCNQADDIARRHLAEVERRITQLEALREELSRMVGECQHGKIGECRIVEVIGDHGHCHQDHARERHTPGA